MKIIKIIIILCVLAVISGNIHGSEYDFTMIKATSEGKERRKALKPKFLERMNMDYKYFSAKELKDIEDLYQTANMKSHTREAQEALKKLISMKRYDNTNRMGCAYLYLGTMDIVEDWEKPGFLKIAIENHSDCWYGDGVQVGPYARYMLGRLYFNGGKKDDAKNLFDEIIEYYPESIDHEGNLLSDKISTYFNF